MSSEKNKRNNAYIQLVEDHEKIINLENEAFEKAGKWKDYFGNENDIFLEIGTGLGNFFSSEVAKNLDKNYIGKEIRFKRLFATAEKTLEKGGENFVLIKTKGENIAEVFAENELSKIIVFFPDPWARKDRQRKNRLFSMAFLENSYKVLKSGGKLIFKTDHREYFDSTLEIIKEFAKFKINKFSYDYENEIEEFDKQNMTEFEHIFREHKIQINYIELEK